MSLFPFQIAGISGVNNVYATVSGTDITVHWTYSGTADSFIVQKYRNGSFKGNTKLPASARQYTYKGASPSPSRKHHFVVYTGGLKKVGESAVIDGSNGATAAVTAQAERIIQTATPESPEKVMAALDKISVANMGVPLPPEVKTSAAKKYADYREQGMSAGETLEKINQELAAAAGKAAPDIQTITSAVPSTPETAVPDTVKTAGASGGNDLLIYGALAAAAVYFFFIKKDSAPKPTPLSGTPRKSKGRKSGKKSPKKR